MQKSVIFFISMHKKALNKKLCDKNLTHTYESVTDGGQHIECESVCDHTLAISSMLSTRVRWQLVL